MFELKSKNLVTQFLGAHHRFSYERLFGTKIQGQYRWITWEDALQSLEHLSVGLMQLDPTLRQPIAIFAENSAQWMLADLSILMSGNFTVPIYSTSTPDQVRYILDHCETHTLFISDSLLKPSFVEMLSSLAHLKHIIILGEPKANVKNKTSILFEDLKKTPLDATSRQKLYAVISQISNQDLSTLIYTSGTTATPKGVMLTHENILSNALSAAKALPIGLSDASVSFLPLSHVFERTAGVYTLMFAGSKIAFAENIAKVGQNILDVNPTVFCTVPRMLEKIHGNILDKLSQKPKWVQWAFFKGLKLSQEKKKTLFSKIFIHVCDRFLFSTVRSKLGTRLRFIVSGGAALSPMLSQFFQSMGLVVLQGYGLTETSPVLCVSRPDNPVPGTVGPAIEGVEVKLAPDGEILAKGPCIMKGYYKDEAGTNAAFTADGFFLTGDLGAFDEHGFLKILERKKEIIVTSGGKNVAPQPLEQELMQTPYVEQACVVGDDEKYLVVLIVPKFAAVGNLFGLPAQTSEDKAKLTADPKVRELFSKLINQVNATKAPYETLKKFDLLTEEFTQENGQLTPTLKLKRRIIVKHHAQKLAKLF